MDAAYALSAPAAAPARTAYTVLGQTFLLDNAYVLTRELGQGAYGCVASAVHQRTGEGVAVKKVTNIFHKRILTKRALREIKLLRHFRGHPNITCLYDMDIIDPTSFNEVYLYEELMEADLHAIIRSGQPLTDAHYQNFIYQTLCGLKYIHSASVLHRDLKPGNLLVNADCGLKICDFGLARGFADDANQQAGGFMTEYVATRWYRAPEIMLSFQNYTTAIDLWSVGCILAELLGGRPIFKGRDYVDQLNLILDVLGTPEEETLSRIGSERAQEYVRSLPPKPKVPWTVKYPNANPEALDLLDKLLAFDPAKRITCEEALQHPYLAAWHDPADEPTCPNKFDFGFENVGDVPGMRNLILNEVRSFRAEVRYHSRAAQQPRRQESLPVPSREQVFSSSDAYAPAATLPEAQVTEDPSGSSSTNQARTHPHRIIKPSGIGPSPGPSDSLATAHEMLERPDTGPRILRPRPPEIVTPLRAQGEDTPELARGGEDFPRLSAPGPTAPSAPRKVYDDPLEPEEELGLLLDRLRARPGHRATPTVGTAFTAATAGESIDRSSGGMGMNRSSTGGEGGKYRDRAWSGSVQLQPMLLQESQDHTVLIPPPEEGYYEQNPTQLGSYGPTGGYMDPYTGPRGVNGRPIAQPPPPRPGTRDHEFGQAPRPGKFRASLASIWGVLSCAPSGQA